MRTSTVHDKAGQVEGMVEVFSDNSLLLAALRQVEELSVEVETDPLTGLGNRRSMQARLDAYLAERRRLGASAGVLFIDIDHFKDVNDTYGHEIGDRVLKMVAETIRQNVTISLGGTLFRPRDTSKTVTARADRLLYESKAKGANLTTLAA